MAITNSSSAKPISVDSSSNRTYNLFLLLVAGLGALVTEFSGMVGVGLLFGIPSWATMAVVVGGMLLAPVLILLVLPVLILRFSKAQELPPEPDREASADGRPGEPTPESGG